MINRHFSIERDKIHNIASKTENNFNLLNLPQNN